MKNLKYLSIAVIGLFFCGTIKHVQDQLIDDNLQIGSDNGQLGEGRRLYFGPPSQNGYDPFWISRYDNSSNVSDLRINLTDDNNGDRLVVGTTFWQDGIFHPYFIVQNNGRVGIGTESIGDERLAVNGTIRAKEVRIEASNWTTPWPDYVFTPAYHLTSLSKVETYINRNHHLPELQSAKEVDEKGVNLGEMNKVLLKKVEELTLYLIEKDKQAKKDEKLINKLSQRLDNIENKQK